MDDIRERVFQWGQTLSEQGKRRRAEGKLVGQGIAIATVQKLLAGTYISIPKQDLSAKIEAAMKSKAS